MATKDGAPGDLVEVAEHAGVSQSAGRRAFTPGASISSKTVAKVLAAPQELGYRPNAIARSLITGRRRIIAVVMAYLENLFYPDVLERLSAALQQKGYHVLLFTGFKDRDTRSGVRPDPAVPRRRHHPRLDLAVLRPRRASAQRRHPGRAVQPRPGGRPPRSASPPQPRRRPAARRFPLVAVGHKSFGYISGFEGTSTNRDRSPASATASRRRASTLYARGVGNFNHPHGRGRGARAC